VSALISTPLRERGVVAQRHDRRDLLGVAVELGELGERPVTGRPVDLRSACGFGRERVQHGPLELGGVLAGPDRLLGAGRGAAVRRDLDPGRRHDPQIRLPDPCPNGQRLAGVARRDAVLVRLEQDQCAARRDPVDDDLGRERERGQRPQRLACAELADCAPTPPAPIRHVDRERVE
jgi:hypothetical protein